MDAKSNTIAVAGVDSQRQTGTPAASVESESSEPQKALHALLDLACTPSSAGLRLAVLACFLVYSFVQTVCRVHDDPWDLAFVVGAYADLALLFWCLQRVERLAPESPAGERRRLQFAVWALSTALSCAFAYRTSQIMPAALVVVIWCMTATVVAVGFYFLVAYKNDRPHHYCAFQNCDGDHGKSFGKKISSEEMV